MVRLNAEAERWVAEKFAESAANHARLREAAQRVLDARTKPYDEYLAAMEGLKAELDGS